MATLVESGLIAPKENYDTPTCKRARRSFTFTAVSYQLGCNHLPIICSSQIQKTQSLTVPALLIRLLILGMPLQLYPGTHHHHRITRENL